MVLVQKWLFFQFFFFQAIQARKMSFTIFYNEKTPFQAIKTQSSNSRNIDIFPKGLTRGFGPKKTIFFNFFFQAIQARKMSFTIFYNEKTPFQAIKTKSSKSRNGVNPWFWSKNGHFFQLFFLGNIGKENVFSDILERKNSFLGYKNKKLEKSKS